MRFGTILLFVFAACSTQRLSDPAALQGMIWNSTTAADAKPAASLQFGAGGEVTGTDGCNRIFGTAVIGERIDMSKVATTRMACIYGRDSAFWAAFAQHDRWRIRGEELQLLQGKKVIWRFVGQAPESESVEEQGEEKE